MKITLPWPPSVNHYYIRTKYGMAISKSGKQYREFAYLALHSMGKMTGPLQISIHAFPPDNRRRDIDNLLKCVLDALQKAGLYDDDFQIQKITIERKEVYETGILEIYLERMEENA